MSKELEGPTDVEILMAKGLSEDEAKALQNFRDRGLPGISKLRADVFEKMYMLGYSCQDIARQYPEYELGLLLHARMKFGWDKIRSDYQVNLASQTANALVLAKAEAIRFLFDVMAATHVKHRNEIMRYLANPEREDAPKFLPDTLSGYGNLIRQLSELMDTNGSTGGANQAANAAIPLVTINMNQGSGDKPTTVEVKQEDVKSALLRKVGKKPEK